MDFGSTTTTASSSVSSERRLAGLWRGDLDVRDATTFAHRRLDLEHGDRTALQRVSGSGLVAAIQRSADRTCRPRGATCSLPSSAGSVNDILSVWPFSRTSTVSPVIGSPRSFTSSIAVPDSSMPSVRTEPVCHDCVVHLAAVRREPGDVLSRRGCSAPGSTCGAESVGCARLKSTSFRAKSSSVCLSSSRFQSIQRELVVLAVRVVVPELRSPQLVAVADHRHALRQQHRRQEVALLPLAQRVDLRIVRRPLGAAVPAQVVVLPVAVLLRRSPRCASRCS